MATDLQAPLKTEAREILMRIAANPSDAAVANQFSARLQQLAARLGKDVFEAIAGEAQQAIGKAIAAAVPLTPSIPPPMAAPKS